MMLCIVNRFPMQTFARLIFILFFINCIVFSWLLFINICTAAYTCCARQLLVKKYDADDDLFVYIVSIGTRPKCVRMCGGLAVFVQYLLRLQMCAQQVDPELEIKAYYAGHVLGAAMFHIRVGSQSVVYTVRSTARGFFLP